MYTDIKVYLPTEQISKMVQQKLFECGNRWFSGNGEKHCKHKWISIDRYGGISYYLYASSFHASKETEISWQEIVYGKDIYFFKHGNSDKIYWRNKESNTYYYMEDDEIKSAIYYDEQYEYLVDMYGNNLGDEEMKKEFTKDDLIIGESVVETREGKKYICLADGILFHSSYSWINLDRYRNDLLRKDTHYESSIYDIMKVFKLFKTGTGRFNFPDDSFLELVWERQEVEEMTVEEIEKELGKKIKIVDKK